MKNFLHIVLPELREALKPFASRRRTSVEAVLAYEAGFASIEAGSIKSVMRATGDWSGIAYFSSEVLRALALVPPASNPVVISYAEGKLVIGTMSVACTWDKYVKPDRYIDIQSLVEPSIIDCLAMERTAPRSKTGASGIARKIRSAREKMERRIKNAAAQLQDLDISEAEIRALVAQKIADRIALEEKTCS